MLQISTLLYIWSCDFFEIAQNETMCGIGNSGQETYVLDGHLWMRASTYAYWNLLLLLFWLNKCWDESLMISLASGLKGLTWWLKHNNNNNIKTSSDDMLYPTDWDEINWLFLKRLCWKFKWPSVQCSLKQGCRKQGEIFYQNKLSNVKNSWR